MKNPLSYILALSAAASFLGGCATHEGTFSPANTMTDNSETSAKFALMDPRAQASVTCTQLQEGKTADGRLQVAANIVNRENRRIEVQAQCRFKDPQGFALDETPWQTVILTENAQDTVRFTAADLKATDYEIRVRGSR